MYVYKRNNATARGSVNTYDKEWDNEIKQRY